MEMSSDKLIEILRDFQGKHYCDLEGESLKLFNAIMKIADQRDSYRIAFLRIKEDLEVYHQNGGTYIIPVEVINQIYGEIEELE